MTFSYETSSPATRDYLRLEIGDTDTVNADRQIFTDEELDMFLTRASSNIYHAAALAMNAIASSSARIAVMIKIGGGDASIDRRTVAAECRKQARMFLEMAKRDDPYATEVALEDKTLTYIDSMGDQSYEYETDLDELNN